MYMNVVKLYYEHVIYTRYTCFWYILMINCISLALRIHVSPDTKEILDTFATFELELRGPVEMKVRHALPVWYRNLDINFGFINAFYRNLTSVFINKKKYKYFLFCRAKVQLLRTG